MVLVLPPELTHVQAKSCLAGLMQGLKSQTNTTVILDASALRRFDSAALAVLLEFKRQCLAASKPMSLVGLPKQLSDLATLYGISELLPEAPKPTSNPVK